MQVSGQDEVAYTYDAADRLTLIAQDTAEVAFAYDAADRRTSLTLPNGIVIEYGYDDASQLTGLTYKLGGNTLGALTYGYDGNGRRTALGGSWARTGLPPALGSATYDDANQIATWASTSFTYDDNGYLTSDGTNSYTWNARNQLASMSGGASASFAYDGVGRRRSRTVGSTTTAFLYDGLNPVQELVGGSASADILAGLGIDEYFTRTDANGARHFLTDALGSTVALGDDSGDVETEYTYQPFGKTTTSGSSTANPFGFTGRENDGTGLQFSRARYYDPRLQRFISEDPLGFLAGDENLHAYVWNAPTSWTDPTGLAAVLLPSPCRSGRGKDLPLLTRFLCSPEATVGGMGIGAAASAAAAGAGAGASAAARSAAATARAVAAAAKKVRIKVGFHSAHHPFTGIGRQPHIQFTVYLKV
jgi:RHS repeat-associated protein